MANNECQVCGKDFRNKTLLKNHERISHNAVYKCPNCSKKMKYLKNFAKHFVDAHHGSMEDAKKIEKSLQLVYTEEAYNDAGKYAY